MLIQSLGADKIICNLWNHRDNVYFLTRNQKQNIKLSTIYLNNMLLQIYFESILCARNT